MFYTNEVRHLTCFIKFTSDSTAAAPTPPLLAPVHCLSLLISQHGGMARPPLLKVTLRAASSFAPLPVKSMCHFPSQACLLFNWHLIFCGWHLEEGEQEAVIVAPIKGGGGGVKCHSV